LILLDRKAECNVKVEFDDANSIPVEFLDKAVYEMVLDGEH